MDILEIQHVSKAYSNHVALNDVSFNIPRGSVFGLLGPNGAGKTSLIRIITQITAPDSGQILFDGKPLSAMHIANMGYLPEERGLYKKMKVGEQALYLAQLKGMNKQEAMKRLKHWFEKFEMQSWWTKKVEDLSKGMQQKVQFITTILHEPEMIILDEPFTGFDPINAELVTNELIALKNKGATIALSTHRMESVEELCTHIALINQSKVVLTGAVKDIKKQFKSNIYELHYTGGNKIGISNALWTGFELLDMKEDHDYNVARIKLLNGSKPNDLLKALLGQMEIHSFNEVIPSMSDIFIRTVGGGKMEDGGGKMEDGSGKMEDGSGKMENSN